MIDRYNTKNPTVGTLYLTATHLIFVEPDSNKETWVSTPDDIINPKHQKHFSFRAKTLFFQLV